MNCNWDWDFNPGIWGTVADWVGGLGTTAAFVAAVIVIGKDANVRRLAQARKVAYGTGMLTVYDDRPNGGTYVRRVPMAQRFPRQDVRQCQM